MGNMKEIDGGMLIGKTIRDVDDNFTDLIKPGEFAKALGIEKSSIDIIVGWL